MNSAKYLNSLEFPIHAAAASGCPQTLTRAIAASSWRDVYSIDLLGRTPLHLAAGAGAVASVAILTHPAMLELQHGVVGNALDAADRESRWTALHCAAYSGRLQIMSMLLRAGADPSVRDSDGMTPWEVFDESIFEYCQLDFPRQLALPPKVCWRSTKKSDAFSFGLTSNYCLGYDSGCHVVAKPRPVSLPSDSALHSVACSCSLSLFVTKDGAVYACGLGDYNRLMIPVPFCVEPVRLSCLPPKIVSVAIGKRHCLALTERGDVYGWGSNDRCQLGSTNALKHQHLLPVKIISGISTISAGFAHSAAVTSSGDTLFVWGDNIACQCSQPSACSVVRSPAAARIPSGLRVIAVSCGLLHTSFVAANVTDAGEPPTAYMFGVGSAATSHLLIFPALSQTNWHLMPDCKVGAIAAGDDWTAVVTLVSQRCYLWRHGGGHVGSPSIISLARHVRVCRMTAAPSRLVLLLSDNTIVSVPVYKRPSDRVVGTPETLCQPVGCYNIAASEGTCLLLCENSQLGGDGMWMNAAAGSSLSDPLPLQRMCEVVLCSTLTSALAPPALELALSIGAPVLAVAAAFACLMDPIYTSGCVMSELAWGLLETVLSRLKLSRSKSVVHPADALPFVQSIAKDLIDDWGGLTLRLIECQGARVCTGSWEVSIARLAKQSKTKQKQKMAHISDSKSDGKCLDSHASSSFPSRSLFPQDAPHLTNDVGQPFVSLESVELRDLSEAVIACSEPPVQSEQFPPLAINIQKRSTARPGQKRVDQAKTPDSRPCTLLSTPSSPSTASCFRLDPHEFPTLLHPAVSSPPLVFSQVTPKTKSKAVRSNQVLSACATELDTFVESTQVDLQRVLVPDTTKKASSSRKNHRQKYRYNPFVRLAVLPSPICAAPST